jgi:hypothetical protein
MQKVKSSVTEIQSNISNLSTDVNNVINMVDSSKWKELGQESISTNVLPTISTKLTNISSDVSNALFNVVNNCIVLYNKCAILKDKDTSYEEAVKEYERIKSSEPSYDSPEYSSWKSKLNDKKNTRDNLERDCKNLTSEIDSLVSTINKTEISDDRVDINTASSINTTSESIAANLTFDSTLRSVDTNSNSFVPIESTTSDVAHVTSDANAKYSVDVPSNIRQSGYTVTGYDRWIKSGQTMVWARGTNQRQVSEVWKSQGSKFKNGIATVNVNGQDRYLIATSSTFGKVGDSVTVKLSNGQSIPCVIADQKSSNDKNYTRYGHIQGNGSVNILEFEVERSKYQSSGNPTTSKWNLEWDSSSSVVTIDNYGSILK